ncbi:SEL1-like repeat protein [bacterium]|nr:SEL1-like repeat protein [bacterium]
MRDKIDVKFMQDAVKKCVDTLGADILSHEIRFKAVICELMPGVSHEEERKLLYSAVKKIGSKLLDVEPNEGARKRAYALFKDEVTEPVLQVFVYALGWKELVIESSSEPKVKAKTLRVSNTSDVSNNYTLTVIVLLVVLILGSIICVKYYNNSRTLFYRAERYMKEGCEDKAKLCYKKAADEGYAEASFRLAGLSYHEDPAFAVSRYEEAENKGYNISGEGAYRVGKYYYDCGDKNKAVKWYEKAEERNYKFGGEGAFRLGQYYYYNDDKDRVAYWYAEAEKRDYNIGGDGAERLGNCYHYAKGNENLAKEWYEKAEKRGHKISAENSYRVAQFYYNEDHKDKAIGWYVKAKARKGWSKSMIDKGPALVCIGLANCYFSESDDKNSKKAVENYKFAYSKGVVTKESKYGLGYYTWYGYGGRRQDLSLGEKYLNEAYDDGKKCNSEMCYDIAEFCLYGENNGGKKINIDYDRAFKWYERSAKRDNVHGIVGLAYCYWNGWGCWSDKKKAADKWKEAADSGDKRAKYELANCYFYGEAVKKDKAKAKALYTEVSKKYDPFYKNFAFSYRNLANICYEDKDYSQAIKWYEDTISKLIAKKSDLSGEEYLRLAMCCLYTGDKKKESNYYNKAKKKGKHSSLLSRDISNTPKKEPLLSEPTSWDDVMSECDEIDESDEQE